MSRVDCLFGGLTVGVVLGGVFMMTVLERNPPPPVVETRVEYREVVPANVWVRGAGGGHIAVSTADGGLSGYVCPGHADRVRLVK